MDRKALIVEHIKSRLKDLKELGQIYSDEKINKLAENLASTPKSLNEINVMIDNKFSNQVRKINHNNHLASLKEYYIASIDKLSKGNNCYLLSYDEGVKVLEQACVKEIKDTHSNQKLVTVNKTKQGYQKENSVGNDYELIMSDIAYLLRIDYARTYRVFDSKMEPKGIINLSFENKDERFLNLEETLRFVKEESSKFTLKNELQEFHDKHIKHGLRETKDIDEIHKNLDYVIKMFNALPDITKDNIEELTNDYLNMKIFELLTNSVDNNPNNIGIIINKESTKYTYRLSPSYNKYTIEYPELDDTKTICNFIKVSKKDLLEVIIKYYYKETKELLTLIFENKDTLLPIIDKIIKEHLTYDEYNKYYNLVSNNLDIITNLVTDKKDKTPDKDEDKDRYEDNNILYNNRIAPFLTNYVSDDNDERGSILLMTIVTIVLFATIAIILLAIIAVSKMDM